MNDSLKLVAQHRQRLLLLVLILLGFVGLKLIFNPGIGRNSLDGDFYYQIARNVEEGRGLQTHLSLYHQGIKSFPQKTNIAPLWPLTLGYGGRALGLYTAARTLPEAFFILDLILLYLLANVLARRLGNTDDAGGILSRKAGFLDVGHLAVLLFGFNPIFFEFTSLPYTESLAFAFLLSALLALDRARNGSLPWAALAGILAAAAFMTRAQMIGVLVAVPAALALLGLRNRRLLVAAFVAAAAAVVTLLPWVLFLKSFVNPFDPSVMVSLAKYRETPEIAPFRQSMSFDSLGARLLDRLKGLFIAFDPRHHESYLASFSWAAWLVPLLGIRLLVSARQGLRDWKSLFETRYLVPIAAGLTALCMLGPIHDRHGLFFKEWLFGFRHGLPLILAIVIALAFFLYRSKRPWQIAALSLTVLSVLSSVFVINDLLQRKHFSGLTTSEQQLVAWLDSRPEPPAVITTNAQTLAAFSRSGFHWMTCGEDSEKTELLLDLANADYVLLYPGEEKCPFLAGLQDRLQMIKVFEGRPFHVGVLAPR